MARIARKFEDLLDRYRRPDGSKWGGQQFQDATAGVITRSYITNLRKGRIENPGYDKLAAIAKAMGFPPKLWFEDLKPADTITHAEAADTTRSLADQVDHLFDAISDDRTGEPYTNAEVARMSLGELTEEDIEGMRSGSATSPSINKIVALAEAFSVHPSYFFDRGVDPPIFDRELLDIFRDETISAIAHKSLHLPDRERQTILGIIQQFENMHETDRQDPL